MRYNPQKRGRMDVNIRWPSGFDVVWLHYIIDFYIWFLLIFTFNCCVGLTNILKCWNHWPDQTWYFLADYGVCFGKSAMPRRPELPWHLKGQVKACQLGPVRRLKTMYMSDDWCPAHVCMPLYLCMCMSTYPFYTYSRYHISTHVYVYA